MAWPNRPVVRLCSAACGRVLASVALVRSGSESVSSSDGSRNAFVGSMA
jgi:hypothetical protein